MENPALAPLLLEVLLPILLPGKFLMHLPVRVETAQLLPLLVITMKRGSYYPLILDLFLFPVIYTDLYRNFLFFSKKIWVKSFLWIFTQILLISYLALFKWSSNYLSDNYFFLFNKIKQKKLLYNTHTFFHPFFHFIPADFHRFCNLIDRQPHLSQRKRCFFCLL